MDPTSLMSILVLPSRRNTCAYLFYRIVPRKTPASPLSFDYVKDTNKEFPYAGFPDSYYTFIYGTKYLSSALLANEHAAQLYLQPTK
jgi:hypothetical protein